MKFLYIFFGLLFSFQSFGFANLPSHFGQEVQIWVISPPIKGMEFSHNKWEVHVDLTSSKFLKNKLFITGKSTLGQDTATLGVSAFYKINDFMFAGGAMHGSKGFEFDQSVTFLFSFKTKYGTIEPFAQIKIQESEFAGGGFRYVNNDMSFTIAAEHSLKGGFGSHWHLMLAGAFVLNTDPFGILNTLGKGLDKAAGNFIKETEDQKKKEIKK